MNFKKTVFSLLLISLSLGAVEAKRFAIVMGSNYTGNSAGIPELELCESDAKLMEQTLKSNGSYDDATVLLGPMVTSSRVKSTLEAIAQKAGKEDVVAIYFSGHGTYQRDASAPNGLRNYIVMYDRPHVSDKELSDWIKGIKTQHVTLIMDCCYSGGIAKKGRRGVGDIPTSPGSDGTVIQNGDENFYFQNKAIIASSDSNETSIEVRGSINHGVFTYWFAQGLDPRNGDLNKDGTVTALEAFEWSSRRVADMAKKQFNHDQNPQISGNAKGIFLAGREVPAPQPPVVTPVVNPPQPDPNKPQPPQPPQPPVVTPVTPTPPNVEPPPENPNTNDTGKVIIATTILRSQLSGTQTPDPAMMMRRMRGVDSDRTVKVRFSGKELPATVTWVDQAGLKAATGEDIPLGTYTVGRQGTPTVVPNTVALIEVNGVPGGVHEVEIISEDYPVIKETIGVEGKNVVKKFVVASLRGTGSIQGRVFLKNFEQPLPGQTIWMPTVVGTNQVHKMKSLTDGSFWFMNLPPGNYYEIKASFEENLKLDNQYIKVKDGDVTKVDIVLSQKNFK
jgi:uncharacterized caspase-like protein